MRETSPAVYLLAAVIAAVGAIVSHNWERIFPPPGETESSVDEEPTRIPNPSQGSPPEVGFGNWIQLDVRTLYLAETDGFVSAYTNGGSDGLRINVGTSPDGLATRGRARSYDGAMTPVASVRQKTP